jgi:hypothetical protein
MKKIALFDPYLSKFTEGMVKWWTDNGYEVKTQRYYNPQIAEWADIIWFDTCDNNLCSATNPGSAIMDDAANYQPWDLHDMDLSKKQIIVRPIDIEVWQGHQHASLWDVVDDIIFIAPHILDIADVHAFPAKRKDARVHVIPHSIDMDKWTFRERKAGFNIAVVSERWMSKGTSEILQVAMKLRSIDDRYKIFWLGQRSDYQWEHAYRDDMVERLDLPIEFINVVDSVDEFLEDKDYLLHASHKEAFSAATAEAMAKGIRPILHHFYGADALWGDMPLWDTIDEAVDMITDDVYDSYSYREFLFNHGYDLPSMMEAIDKVIKLKEF